MTLQRARAMPNEVQLVDWLTPVEAVAALTHDDDRKPVTRVFEIEGQTTCTQKVVGAAPKKLTLALPQP